MKAAWDDDLPAVMEDIARQQYGLDGSGIGIAVIDSGVYHHNDLKNANNTASRLSTVKALCRAIQAPMMLRTRYARGRHSRRQWP